MLNGQGKTKSFRFSPKGGEIPRYNLGEIISLTFDITSMGTIQRTQFSAERTGPIIRLSDPARQRKKASSAATPTGGQVSAGNPASTKTEQALSIITIRKRL